MRKVISVTDSKEVFCKAAFAYEFNYYFYVY